MSHIFDAIQRSEDERAEIDSPVPSEATELLLRAERRAASRWESAASLRQVEVAEVTGQEEPLQAQAPTPAVTVAKVPAPVQVAAVDTRADAFSQFEELPVVLTSQNHLVCFTDEESLAAEAFRLLGVRMQHLRRDRSLKKVLITSTIPQEGKSMVAANLACTLARRTQQKVVLLEGDLRRPSLSQEFGLGRHPGLCECLQGERTLEKSIYHLEGPGLWILPAGSSYGNALELLQSARLSAVMEQLTGWFDWVIIDSPPVLPLADTSVWARLAEGILMVTRQGVTEKRHLQRGLDALEKKKLIGALLNCSQSASHSDYYYRAIDAPRLNEGMNK